MSSYNSRSHNRSTWWEGTCCEIPFLVDWQGWNTELRACVGSGSTVNWLHGRINSSAYTVGKTKIIPMQAAFEIQFHYIQYYFQHSFLQTVSIYRRYNGRLLLLRSTGLELCTVYTTGLLHLTKRDTTWKAEHKYY